MVRERNDAIRGPIVRFEAHSGGAGNVAVEVDQVVHVRTAEAVDRLEVVAHRSERRSTIGKSIDPHDFQQFALRHVGVLELVEQHRPVSKPQRVGDRRIATHRFHGQCNLIAEIEHAEPPLGRSIRIEEDAQIRTATSHPTDPRGERPIAGHGQTVGPQCLNGDEVVGQRGRQGQGLLHELLWAAKLAVRKVHPMELVEQKLERSRPIKQARFAGQTQRDRMFTDNLGAEAVIGRHLHAVARTEAADDPVPQVRRGLVRERQAENLVVTHRTALHEADHALGHHLGLAGTGAGNDA